MSGQRQGLSPPPQTTGEWANVCVSFSSSSVVVNKETITLRVGGQAKGNLSLATPRPAFSWLNLVLARPDSKSLLVYAPEDRLRVLATDAALGERVFLSSVNVTHVTFNCILGELVECATEDFIGFEMLVTVNLPGGLGKQS